MLRWRHLTPEFVDSGIFRVKRAALCAVVELGEAGSISYAQ